MNVTGEDVDSLSRHFWLLPLIGLFYGVVAGGALYLLAPVLGPLVSAVLVLLIVHGLNRFLHFDGLIDLGDGFIATGSQEKKLTALKDTRVGAGGVGFGILFTMLQVAALALVAEEAYHPSLLFFLPLAMEVLAKNALVTAAALGKAREGLGSPFVRNTPPLHAALSAVLSFLLLAAVLVLIGNWYTAYMVPLIVLMVLASSVVSVIVAALAHRSFGCVNGDVLGATNELAKPFVLIAGMVGVVLFLLMFS